MERLTPKKSPYYSLYAIALYALNGWLIAICWVPAFLERPAAVNNSMEVAQSRPPNIQQITQDFPAPYTASVTLYIFPSARNVWRQVGAFPLI